MKKGHIEWIIACLLLISFYFLSKEAAVASKVWFGVEQPENGEEEKADTEGRAVPNETEKKGKIVIDPGHGGIDPGMIGIGKLEEKGINLEISIRLKDFLEESGYQVILTRMQDEGLYEENALNKKVQDMQKRIQVVAEETPLLLISIHQNSYEDERVCGPQVFYYETSAEGKKLAEMIQERLNQIPDVARQREVKGNTSYYLLKKSPAVSVIVECGFLTNPTEAQRLKSADYQEEVARAIEKGIEEYLQQ